MTKKEKGGEMHRPELICLKASGNLYPTVFFQRREGKMIRKTFLKIVLILSLSTFFILTLSGIGICLDKAKVDLSEYRGIENRTFAAYKYAFGVRKAGTLQIVTTPLDTGFHQEWYEEYPFPNGDGTALYLAFDYDVTSVGAFEKNIYRFAVNLDESGNPYRGDLLNLTIYREPAGAVPGTLAMPHPLLVFPYAVVDVGYTWGDAFIEKVQMQPIFFPRVYQYALLGVEDVTVPAGTFTECIKIARFRGNQADRIAWYAKGIGTVKMIYAQEEHSHVINGIPTQVQGYNRAFVLQSLD